MFFSASLPFNCALCAINHLFWVCVCVCEIFMHCSGALGTLQPALLLFSLLILLLLPALSLFQHTSPVSNSWFGSAAVHCWLSSSFSCTFSISLPSLCDRARASPFESRTPPAPRALCPYSPPFFKTIWTLHFTFTWRNYASEQLPKSSQH